MSGWNKYIYQDWKEDVITMKSPYDALNTFNLMSPLSLLWGMLNLCLCTWRNYGQNQKMLSLRKFPSDKVWGEKFTSLTVVFACLLKYDKVGARRERYSFPKTIQSSSGAQIARAPSTWEHPPLPPIMTRLPQSNREGNKNKKLQKGEVHVALTWSDWLVGIRCLCWEML